VTGTKLFFNDLAILNYSKSGCLDGSISWPDGRQTTPDRLRFLEPLVASMLDIDPHRRPNAGQIQKEVGLIRSGTAEGRPFRFGRPLQVHTSFSFNISAISG
jgi:hypothetical protein